VVSGKDELMNKSFFILISADKNELTVKLTGTIKAMASSSQAICEVTEKIR